MSNCVVRSRGSRHDGDDNDFWLLFDRGETVVEDLEGGIVSGCAEGMHCVCFPARCCLPSTAGL
jgi:hypothetical protein